MIKKYLFSFALSAIVLAGCGEKETPPAPLVKAPIAINANAEEKILNIYNWPDYIPEGMIAAFEKESGIKVNYHTFESNEILQAKLMTGNSDYDIVVPGVMFAKPQIEAGLLQPLNKAKISNLSNLDPAVMAKLTKADPDNKYLVPWAWSFITVGINKTKVDKALAGMPMPENAWDLVFNPKYTAKLKSCGIAYFDSPTEIIPTALHYLGKDPYSKDKADYKIATDMLDKVRKDIDLFSAVIIDDIASGKACAAIAWSGDINIAAERAKPNNDGSKDVIQTLLPRTGALMLVDTMALTKNAKHPNNAHAFIDFYLRADNAAHMSNEMNYATGNTLALAKIKPKILGNKSIFVEPGYLTKLVPPSSFSSESREALASAYNGLKNGK